MHSKGECSYCGGSHFENVETDRKRHPHHKTVKCMNCAGYSVRHRNGTVFRLVDKANKEADAFNG